jgi:hypothetical protein
MNLIDDYKARLRTPEMRRAIYKSRIRGFTFFIYGMICAFIYEYIPINLSLYMCLMLVSGAIGSYVIAEYATRKKFSR